MKLETFSGVELDLRAGVQLINTIQIEFNNVVNDQPLLLTRPAYQTLIVDDIIKLDLNSVN